MWLKTLSIAPWLLLSLAAALLAEEKGRDREAQASPSSPQFVRIVRNEDGVPISMDTAIVSYVTADKQPGGLVVDLVGAVHIADKRYFDRLNQLFESYDVVLYELVAPEGTRIPKDERRRGGHPVTGVQVGFKSLLELEFQLDCIDYTKNNLVHADMSPDEFAKSMKDRGESFMQMFFRMIGQGLAAQAKAPERSSDSDLLLALFAEDRALRLKRIIAEQFEDLEGSMAAIEGPDGSTLITERNKKALEILDRELKAGKRRVAIFYGAGHLPDMEKRLLESFGMQRSTERWLSAWAMQKGGP
jgi:hypothetical protein